MKTAAFNDIKKFLLRFSETFETTVLHHDILNGKVVGERAKTNSCRGVYKLIKNHLYFYVPSE